ncbi:MAG: hypothetical protein REH83_05340 [Rickettsiella sp.]|nr:hypothetical protein [Rickettsiella sp.]
MANNMQYAKSKPSEKSFIHFSSEVEFKAFIESLSAKTRKGYVNRCKVEFAQQKTRLEKNNVELTRKIANLNNEEKYERKYQTLYKEIGALHELYLQAKHNGNVNDMPQVDIQTENNSSVIDEDETLLAKHLLACYESVRFLCNDIEITKYEPNFSDSMLQRAQADDISVMLQIYVDWTSLKAKNKSLESEWKTLSEGKKTNDFQQKFMTLFSLIETIYTTFNNKSAGSSDNEENEKGGPSVQPLSIDKFTSREMLKKDLESRGLEAFTQVSTYIQDFKTKNLNLNSEIELLESKIAKIEKAQYQTDYNKLCEEIKSLYQATKKIEGIVEIKPEKEHELLAKKLLIFYTTLKAAWATLNTTSDQSKNFTIAMTESEGVNPLEDLWVLFDECEALKLKKKNYEDVIAQQVFKDKEDEQEKFLKQYNVLFGKIKEICYATALDEPEVEIT